MKGEYNYCDSEKFKNISFNPSDDGSKNGARAIYSVRNSNQKMLEIP